MTGLFWMAALVATAGETEKPPAFTYKLKKADDQIQASLAKDAVVFQVTNPSGTGAAEITLSEGAWPKQVVVRFVKAAAYLEFFQVKNDRLLLSGPLKDFPKTTWHYDRKGKATEDPKQAEYEMTILYNKDERTMEVRLPAGFCTNSKTLRFEWIDAARR